MSLVGTRPPTVDEWDKYELHHRARLATKPGLTGMWQVSGRSNITDFGMAGFVLKNTLSDNGGVTRGICKMDTENVSVEIIDFSNEAQLNMYTKKELIGLV